MFASTVLRFCPLMSYNTTEMSWFETMWQHDLLHPKICQGYESPPMWTMALIDDSLPSCVYLKCACSKQHRIIGTEMILYIDSNWSMLVEALGVWRIGIQGASQLFYE